MERDDRRQWQEPNLWVPALVVMAVLAAAVYFWPVVEKPKEFVKLEPPPAPPEEEVQPQRQLEIPEIQYPVPQETGIQEEITAPAPEQEEAELPRLNESDDFVREEFRHLYDEQKFGSLFLLQDIIRRIVVMVDNMTATKLPQKFTFTKPPAGKFMVFKDAADNEFIDNANYDRYRPYVELAETADLRRFVSFYVRYYPLFQDAYRELGYPDRYFNDRFVQVLDHLLAAPEIRTPIKLVRPKVYYQFADPDLEALSAGQKIMVRIGPDNAIKVKARLAELRRALTTLKVKP